jgi:hypothetical protein
MNIKEIEIDKLKLDPKNARKHDEKNIRMIAASLKEFGQQRLPVVRQDFTIIAGNGTIIAATSLGWQKINVVVSDLDDNKALAYSLADNQIATTSSWDLEVYGLNLQEIKDSNWLKDWNAIGFEKDEINLFLSANWSNTEPIADGDNNNSEPDKSGLKEEFGKPVKLTLDQRKIFDDAARIIKTNQSDSKLSDGRIVEFISIEYINGI